eukprot:CAMPEP_0113517444 /NCGR_PEP_ID=MMETSP0014_2-20120614/42256_1 /TAXON_ID=2857 /ORGANISM="Nitzschia sp." /LENGTH=58 /DNA_ID=CAMNT_0000414629 /DNA_START=1 /DNA_END=175 /DNA_ORIENTATION=- /assembly_acc=CAM_ASM_000159
MEGAYAEKDPLTMEDCALVAEACLTGRLTGAYAEKDPLTMEDCASVAEACLTGRLTAD